MAVTIHRPHASDLGRPSTVIGAGLLAAALAAASFVVVQQVTEDSPAITVPAVSLGGGEGVTASYPGIAGAPSPAELSLVQGVTTSYPGIGAPVAIPASSESGGALAPNHPANFPQASLVPANAR